MNSFNYDILLSQNALREEEKLCPVTVQWTKIQYSQILAVLVVGEWIEQKGQSCL